MGSRLTATARTASAMCHGKCRKRQFPSDAPKSTARTGSMISGGGARTGWVARKDICG